MKRFRMTEDHIKLLRKMCVDWYDCETGAPCIDPKRPYGNSDVAGDIHKILTGEDFDFNRESNEADKLACKYDELHCETKTALQIVLATGEFEPGLYECQEYGGKWKKVNE